jgi:hypothetical protein
VPRLGQGRLLPFLAKLPQPPGKALPVDIQGNNGLSRARNVVAKFASAALKIGQNSLSYLEGSILCLYERAE